MNAPICEECIEKGELCGECEQKKNKGEVTELDISLARLLRRMEMKDLVKNPSFEKTVDLDDMIIVVTNARVGNLVGKGGRIVRVLKKELGKKVRVINGKDFKSSMQDLVSPARLTSVNTVFSQDGEYFKVILPSGEARKLTASKESIENAGKALSGKQVVLEFE
ncbi:MAG: KH domain-containing protein [Candidatus Diapherotrites archaeon]|nr:KH domain-containing protein [Candidatus Diapherotrites archaeon]